MKFSKSLPLLVGCTQGFTLLGGLYETVADTLVNQITGTLEGLASDGGPLSTPPTLKASIDAFSEELKQLPKDDLVDLLKSVDPEELFDSDGNFKPEALSTVFSADDIAPLATAMQAAFTDAIDGGGDIDAAKLKSSMTSFLDLGEVFQDIMNNEVQASNFLAVANDLTSAIQSMDGAFQNGILGSGGMNTFIQVINIGSIIGEKALIAYEAVDKIVPAFEDANYLIESGWNRVETEIWEMDSPEDYMCAMVQRGVFKAGAELFDFFNDVTLQNLQTPVGEVVDVYNGLVHGLPFIPDLLDEIEKEDLNKYFDLTQSYLEAASSSMLELGILTLPFQTQVANFLEPLVCP